MTQQSPSPTSGLAPADLGACAPANLDKTDPLALCFSGPQDAINFARDGVEDANRRTASNAVEVVKGYIEGKIALVLKMPAGTDSGDYDVVFLAVKNGIKDCSIVAENPAFKGEACARYANGHQESVFIGVTELVEGPEGVIPSLMRVERPKERTDFRRQIFASPLGVRIKVEGGIGEGEVGIFGINNPGVDRDSISALIQRRAQGFNSLDSVIGPTIGEFAIELKNMKPGAVRTMLNGGSSWFVFEEGCDTFFKPTNLSLCAA